MRSGQPGDDRTLEKGPPSTLSMSSPQAAGRDQDPRRSRNSSFATPSVILEAGRTTLRCCKETARRLLSVNCCVPSGISSKEGRPSKEEREGDGESEAERVRLSEVARLPLRLTEAVTEEDEDGEPDAESVRG